MNPSDLDRFLGVWRANPGIPLSNHTFTWHWDGVELRGRWLIAMADSPKARAAIETGHPREIEMPVGRTRLEDGMILFYSDERGFVMEFRLVTEDEAVVGAAVHKLEGVLPSDLARSIEGHRVRFRRGAAGAA
jgi:hypothetical protein